eukprot:TRINITY_DN15656_c0_g2_i1.p1 TRINITY_DN15656_c0_g2~~TRINITY_DN15656_c0_g2_i1.p1  ORF type:complete len:375 (-),score=74.23 TRINITY_DN15656_c0_g2_i1:236-1279(-)
MRVWHSGHGISIEERNFSTVIRKCSGDKGNYDAFAVFDVPDTRHFEFAVTATRTESAESNNFLVGIVPAVNAKRLASWYMEDEPEIWKEWCLKWGLFLMGTGDFMVDSPTDMDVQSGLRGNLAKGSSLSLLFARGALAARINEEEWKSIHPKLTTKPDPDQDYCPCVFARTMSLDLIVRVRRKRGRPDGFCEGKDRAMWERRRFTDASVECEGAAFPVHRAVLVAASPVFESAFSGAMREAQEAKLLIRDAEPGAVEAMLRYVYMGQLPEASSELLVPLLELSVRYELTELCRELADVLVDQLTPTNVRAITVGLKRHREHHCVAPVWPRFLASVREDTALLENALV